MFGRLGRLSLSLMYGGGQLLYLNLSLNILKDFETGVRGVREFQETRGSLREPEGTER